MATKIWRQPLISGRPMLTHERPFAHGETVDSIISKFLQFGQGHNGCTVAVQGGPGVGKTAVISDVQVALRRHHFRCEFLT